MVTLMGERDMNALNALETVLWAAKQYAQLIEDDADADDSAREQAADIWEAIEAVSEQGKVK